MRKVRSTGTEPEVKLRKRLWAAGLRYTISPSALPGKPDIVLPAKRLAIFVDGDFWHGGQWRKRNLPALEDQFRETPSRQYWLGKIRRNMARDCVTTAALLSKGWTVLRFWESEIRRDLERCAHMVLEVALKGTEANARALLPQKTVAEFFAGIGLMRMGLERQGWRVAFANDIDRQKHAMYQGHFGADAQFVLGDIHAIPVERVPTVALATASFPCNDLSLAGSRRGLSGKQSSAFWGFLRILAALGMRKPPLVLLENVTGFLTSRGGEDFKEALIALNRLGYAVDAFILDAARFVPQSRQRLFVVGVSDELYGSASPAPDSREVYESDVRPRPLVDFILSHSGIAWNIRELPSPPRHEAPVAAILDDLPDDAGEWWSKERAAYLLSQMSAAHRALAERMIAGAEWSYGTVFRRVRNGTSMAELRTDGIAGCLRTPRGGSGRQILLKAGFGQYFVRLLTPRECARLMGADDYKLPASATQALFGFGDAVCVPAIEWIAEYYLNPLINELIRGRPLRAYAEPL